MFLYRYSIFLYCQLNNCDYNREMIEGGVGRWDGKKNKICFSFFSSTNRVDEWHYYRGSKLEIPCRKSHASGCADQKSERDLSAHPSRKASTGAGSLHPVIFFFSSITPNILFYYYYYEGGDSQITCFLSLNIDSNHNYIINSSPSSKLLDRHAFTHSFEKKKTKKIDSNKSKNKIRCPRSG